MAWHLSTGSVLPFLFLQFLIYKTSEDVFGKKTCLWKGSPKIEER